MTFPPAILAIGFVLAAAAGGSGDYGDDLVISWPDGTELHVCSKPPFAMLNACEEARQKRWQPLNVPPVKDAVMVCIPNGCEFPASEGCIKGYRGPRPEGRC